MNPRNMADSLENALRLFVFAPRFLLKRNQRPVACGALYTDGSWVGAPVTVDQMRIERYLQRVPLEGRAVLHVGVGSSHLASRLARRCGAIDGITVIEEEKEHGDSLGLPNYRVRLADKYSDQVLALDRTYDYIVDNNPSSYAPSREAVDAMIGRYVRLLEPGGAVLTDRLGMRFHRPFAFAMTDDDLRAYEGLFPVKYASVTRTVRALIKARDAGAPPPRP